MHLNLILVLNMSLDIRFDVINSHPFHIMEREHKGIYFLMQLDICEFYWSMQYAEQWCTNFTVLNQYADNLLNPYLKINIYNDLSLILSDIDFCIWCIVHINLPHFGSSSHAFICPSVRPTLQVPSCGQPTRETAGQCSSVWYPTTLW